MVLYCKNTESNGLPYLVFDSNTPHPLPTYPSPKDSDEIDVLLRPNASVSQLFI